MSAEKDLYIGPSPGGFRYGSIGPSVGNSIHPPSHSVYSSAFGKYVEGSLFALNGQVLVRRQGKKMSVAQKFWSARAVPVVKRRVRLCAFLCITF